MMGWLTTALKVLPWGDMIEYAPKLVNGAQKLWQRMKTESAETDAIVIEHAPQSEEETVRELRELKQQLHDMHAQQLELSNLVTELAAQNERLVGALGILRARTRFLFVLVVAVGVACTYLLVVR